jgi:hypothetical protein
VHSFWHSNGDSIAFFSPQRNRKGSGDKAENFLAGAEFAEKSSKHIPGLNQDIKILI